MEKLKLKFLGRTPFKHGIYFECLHTGKKKFNKKNNTNYCKKCRKEQKEKGNETIKD